MRKICYIQPLSSEEYRKYLPQTKLVPKKLFAKLLPMMPALDLATIKFQLKKEILLLRIIGFASGGSLGKLNKKLTRVDFELVFTDKQILPLEKIKSGGRQILVFNGEKVGPPLFVTAIKKSFASCQDLAPKIVVAGADCDLGGTFARLCSQNWRNVIIAGEDQAKLRSLAHSLIFQTGVSPKISTNLVRDCKNANLIVQARPWPTLEQLTSSFLDSDTPFDFKISGPPFTIENIRSKAYQFSWSVPLIEAVLTLVMGKKERKLQDENLRHDSWDVSNGNDKRFLSEGDFSISFARKPRLVPIYLDKN